MRLSPSLLAINPHLAHARPQPHPEVPGGWVVWVPGLELPSAANLREHPYQRAARVRRQREAVSDAMRSLDTQLPLRVVLVRVAPRALDSDNLAGALKAVRDGVAAWIGVDDAHPSVEWLVAQEPLQAEGPGLRIELVPRPRAPRSRVDLGAVTRVRLRLTPDERASLARTLADPEADEVRLEVGDLTLTLAGDRP